jgi:hypothetical protein
MHIVFESVWIIELTGFCFRICKFRQRKSIEPVDFSFSMKTASRKYANAFQLLIQTGMNSPFALVYDDP